MSNNTQTRHEKYFKGLMWTLVFCFVFLGLFWLYNYYDSKRYVSVNHIKTVEDLRFRGHTERAYEYLHALPTEEFWDVWPVFYKKIETIEPFFYYEIARRYWERGQKTEALFWAVAAQFRMDYDAARCIGGNKTELLSWYHYFTQKMMTPEISDYMDANPDEAARAVEDVLTWDAENGGSPAPEYFCRYLVLPYDQRGLYVPQKEWLRIKKKILDDYYAVVIENRAKKDKPEESLKDEPQTSPQEEIIHEEQQP